MRKVLLLSAALLISAGIMAQTVAPKIIGASNKYEKVQISKKMFGTESSTGFVPERPNNPTNKDVQAVTKVKMGSSLNIYTCLVSESAGMTANPETGVVGMIHRSNLSGAVTGDIYFSFSSDKGMTWDSTTVYLYDGSTNGGRYPNAMIYNPTGNTTAANAYVVGTGPMLLGTSSWGGNFFASMQLDGTGQNVQTTLYTTDTAGGTGYLNQFARLHGQARGDKFWALGDANTDDGQFYTGFTTIINKGTWDATGDSVIWTRTAHVPDYLTDGSGNPDGYATPGLVMADDGMTGYLAYIGRDGASTDNLTYQPLVYKTTDGGNTWAKEAAFNWGTITTLQTLATSLSPVGRPMFSSIKDITLDSDGYVHLIGYIHGAYSDNVDSLGYYAVFNGMNGIICDIHQTASGWDAFIIDTVYTYDPDETTTLIDPNTADALEWDERLQMSTSPDRTKIFYSWMDTDTTLSVDNIYPDIIVKMYDVSTGTLYPDVNLTKGTAYDGNNYWMYLSDIAFEESGIYQLHISTSSLNSDDVGPVSHYYFQGVYLDGTGQLVADVAELGLENVISMYPNPTSDNLNLSFNSNAAGDYNVVIYNTLGSVVSSEFISVNGAAVQTISLENLPTGIYMVEISNENSTMTQKVIKN
ncbi:MAG: hypothetical protein C0592_05330 [Marinilabiliales bacterium]|nr:MAG: hypothetical protein C0592_05330 [Marinilabiliales bacterium]